MCPIVADQPTKTAPLMTERASQAAPERRYPERVRPTSKQQKMVSFCFGEQHYAIPLTAVQEILPMPLLSQPPRMPSLLDGFLNLGGTATAVVSLARLFNLPETAATLYTPLLLLRGKPIPIALRVERVLGVVSVSEDAKVRLEDNSACNDCAQGVAIIDDRVLVILSWERILFEQERACLAELQATEQMRLDALQEPSQNRLGEGDSPQFCSEDSAKMETVPSGLVRRSQEAAP